MHNPLACLDKDGVKSCGRAAILSPNIARNYHFRMTCPRDINPCNATDFGSVTADTNLLKYASQLSVAIQEVRNKIGLEE